MTFGQIRFVKRALLLLFVVLGVYVGRQVWQGVRGRESRSGSEPVEVEASSPTSREVRIEQLDSDGRTAWTLTAAESTGHTETAQTFRDVEIRFEAGEEKVPVVVTGDHCEIEKDSSVYLEGNVVVRDDSTLRLESDTLRFQRHPDRAWSRDPVRYSRQGLSGTAGSLDYSLVDGVLELGSGVAMTLQEEGEAPVRIESERSILRRRQHVVQFIDAVRVRQTNRALDCGDLQVYFDEANENIERMEAYESVDLRMNVEGGEIVEAEATKTALASEPGTKRLLSEKLEVFFRPGGSELERVRALEGGTLVMRLPESARTGYHKDLEGYTLVFEFDEQGRLQVLRGRGGVTLVLMPVVEGSEPKKTVTARQLEAYFDPVTGELGDAICEKAVTFEQGEVRATGEKGTFRNAESLLRLEEGPRLWDAKANLEATVIEIDTVSGDVAGIGNVRSTSKESSGPGGLFPSESNEPVYFVSEEMRYDRARDSAVYTGAARGIQGPNRIEAARIEIQQAKGELTAAGEVRTTLLQQVGDEGEERAEPTVTTAERFRYLSKEETLHYEGSVAMRSREMTMRGETVDVSLVPTNDGGKEVSEILASGEVTIETPDGKAAGDDAKYLPKEESMTVTGVAARLENDGKLTEGKQLTFFLGNDRILVDGREQARTKTTFSSKPHP